MNGAWFPSSLHIYKVETPDIASGSNAGGKKGVRGTVHEHPGSGSESLDFKGNSE